mgnify:CR=1 FL=1|jgi:hypothetical protein
MHVKCGPKGTDGERASVSNSCCEACPFWKRCLDEIEIDSIPNHFVEMEPNKYEMADGIFHIDYKGLKKVWILMKKQYGRAS